jgi:hypothetical protein
MKSETMTILSLVCWAVIALLFALASLADYQMQEHKI